MTKRLELKEQFIETIGSYFGVFTVVKSCHLFENGQQNLAFP